jgi:glycosyltransferase involved in cell wall biosynthesis
MSYTAQDRGRTAESAFSAPLNRRGGPSDRGHWRRLIKPIREMAGLEPDANFWSLVVRVCSRYAFDYRPLPTPSGPWPEPLRGAWGGRPRIGLFVDSPDHLSGVARTLGHWQREADATGVGLRMHGATPHPRPGGPMTLFPAVGTLSMSAYEGLEMHVPPVREVLRYIKQSEFDIIHISTPGLMGLTALLAARIAGLPVVSTFHTHFPSYAARLLNDPALEDLTWSLMRWFYRQMDRVAAPTPTIRQELIDQGCCPSRVCVVGRGVDTNLFHPCRRSEDFRREHVHPRRVALLYVGRLSREKNLPLLAESFARLAEMRRDIALVVVGDGPYRAEMEAKLAGLPARFLGVLHGEALARTYASCDAFVFPSETDTLGNVVLEAQASGLPVIVSGLGGPKDCMQDGVTGLVVPSITATALVNVLLDICDHPARMKEMGVAAHYFSRRFTHAASFDAFRRLHEGVLATRV